MRRLVCACVVFSALSACVQQQQRPTAQYVPNIPFTPEQVDKMCIINSGHELRKVLNLEATGGRALAKPNNAVDERIVELDTKSAGISVTYMFSCTVLPTGTVLTPPIGRKIE